jgi:hypothetical protein
MGYFRPKHVAIAPIRVSAEEQRVNKSISSEKKILELMSFQTYKGVLSS